MQRSQKEALPKKIKLTVIGSASKATTGVLAKRAAKQKAAKKSAKGATAKPSNRKTTKPLLDDKAKAKPPDKRATAIQREKKKKGIAKKTAKNGVAAQLRKRPTVDQIHRHPGEILLELFMKPMGLNAHRLGLILHVPSQRIGEIINCRRGVTAETALRLARLFGTTARFWLDLQIDYDLNQTKQKWSSINREIKPIESRLPGEKTTVLTPVTSLASTKRQKLEQEQKQKLKQEQEQKQLKQQQELKLKQQQALRDLSADQKKIYKLLPDDDVINFDVLFEKVGLTVGKLTAELTMMELSNLVESHYGNYYKRKSFS